MNLNKNNLMIFFVFINEIKDMILEVEVEVIFEFCWEEMY